MYRLPRTLAVISGLVAWMITGSAAQDTQESPSWVGGVQDDLATRLSPAAKIFFPGSSEFELASRRWSVLEAPIVNVAIVPGTAQDVAETVSFHSFPLVSRQGCSVRSMAV
jgi:hypothetical protein